VAAGLGADPYVLPDVAPTVTTLQPFIRGYDLNIRRIIPNGDGVNDRVTVAYDLASAVIDLRLDVLRSDGTPAATLALGPQPMGPGTATWDGRLGDGSWAAGTYLLRLTATAGTATHTAPAAVVDPEVLRAWDVAASVGPSGATYVPLPPNRLLDSRNANGLSGAFGSGVARTFQVTGRGGVPAGAVAVSGTLTVTGQATAGWVYLGPIPLATPTSSTLNAPAADTRATGVTVALGSGGSLSATWISGGGGAAHLVFDVGGAFIR
jgi:hypothetical protein